MNTVDRGRVFGQRPHGIERIAPGYFPPGFVAEHVARYNWAARWAPGREVLDVACGTGYGAPVLRKAGAKRVLSLDLSREALWFGVKSYAITAACSDGLHLPVPNATHDVVISLETIEHVTDPVLFAKELRRVLRQGGDLLLSTPNASRSKGTNPYHLHEMTLEEMRALLLEAGFRLKKLWGQRWGFLEGPWHRIVGVRRVLHEIEKIPAIIPWVQVGPKPIYMCLHAVAV